MVTSRSAPLAPRGDGAQRLARIVARDAEIDRLAAPGAHEGGERQGRWS